MQPSPELVGLVEDWFAAASRGDPSLVARHVHPGTGTRLIGSDPDEWLRGGPDVAAFLRGEVEGSGGQVSFAPSDTEAFTEGSAGWAATRLRITLPDGGHVSPRWSAVFVHDGSVWQFVQTHASIAVTNDQIGWTYA